MEVAGAVEFRAGRTLEEGPFGCIHPARPVNLGKVAGKLPVLRDRNVHAYRQTATQRDSQSPEPHRSTNPNDQFSFSPPQ